MSKEAPKRKQPRKRRKPSPANQPPAPWYKDLSMEEMLRQIEEGRPAHLPDYLDRLVKKQAAREAAEPTTKERTLQPGEEDYRRRVDAPLYEITRVGPPTPSVRPGQLFDGVLCELNWKPLLHAAGLSPRGTPFTFERQGLLSMLSPPGLDLTDETLHRIVSELNIPDSEWLAGLRKQLGLPDDPEDRRKKRERAVDWKLQEHQGHQRGAIDWLFEQDGVLRVRWAWEEGEWEALGDAGSKEQSPRSDLPTRRATNPAAHFGLIAACLTDCEGYPRHRAERIIELVRSKPLSQFRTSLTQGRDKRKADHGGVCPLHPCSAMLQAAMEAEGGQYRDFQALG